MLSSRYLHLHEALGLGPMWLKHGAKALAPQPAKPTPPIATVVSEPPGGVGKTNPIQAESTITAERIAAARTATIAMLDRQIISPAPDPTPTNTPTALYIPSEAELQPAALMVLSICPSLEDQVAGQLFSGSVGTLLDNMLAAIELPATQAHRSCWIKISESINPQPETETLAAALPALQAELEAVQARAVLLLGQVFEAEHYQALLHELCANRPFFIIPHPAKLLRQPKLKAHAWEVLKQVKNVLAPSPDTHPRRS